MKILAAVLALLLPVCVQAQTKIQGGPIQIGGSNSSSGGVTSLKADGYTPLTGDVTIACGSGLSCVQSGNTINVSVATALSILSFTGYQLVEVGTSIANPSFTALYNTLPNSAQITNTEGISSPTVLSTPFTSGTVTGTFAHNTPTTTTFTLSATLGTTVTQTQTLNWADAIFGGVGSAGATPTVTASGTTAVLSTGDVLPRVQLGTESLGQTLGPFSPAGQYVYLLLVNPGHTFIDANTGLPFAIDAPITVSFVNVNGVTVTMYLYRSSNPLFVPVNPKVAT